MKIQIVVEVEDNVLAVLVALAETEDRPFSNYVSRILSTHAFGAARGAEQLAAALAAVKAASGPAEFASERDVETALCEALDAAGIAYQRQQITEAGIADVVAGGTVIEVKREIRNPRDFHAAYGQAVAYGKAIGLSKAMVVAGRVSDSATGRFDRLLTVAEAVAELMEGDSHVVTLPARA